MLLYFHSDFMLLLDELLVLLRPGKNDVEDALVDELEEPLDNPGTTIATWFSGLLVYLRGAPL